MAASNPNGEMQFWSNGAPFGGVLLGTNDGGEMQFWASGAPFGFLFPAASVSVALSGIASTGSPGSMVGSAIVALSGSAGAFGQGTMVAGIVQSAALSGQSLTASDGSLGFTSSVPMSGASATASPGSFYVSLFNNLSVIATSGNNNDSKAFAWSQTGVLNGILDPPNILSTEGGVALSEADNRIYLIAKDGSGGGGDIALVIFDNTGVLVGATAFRDHYVSPGTVRGLYVPEPGLVWASLDGGAGAGGEIWEYTSDGVFVQEIASGMNTAHAISSPNRITHRGDTIYFTPIGGVGADTTSTFADGIYRHRISTNTALSVLVANTTGGISWDMKRTEDGKLLQGLNNRGARLVAEDGTVEKTYTYPGTWVYGIAPDADGTTFWVGDGGVSPGEIWQLSLADGSVVSSFPIDEGGTYHYGDYSFAALLADPSYALTGSVATMGIGTMSVAARSIAMSGSESTADPGTLVAYASGGNVSVSDKGFPQRRLTIFSDHTVATNPLRRVIFYKG